LGILRDAHIGNLTDLTNAIERGRPLSDGAFSREIGRPQQQILHEFFQWKNIIDLENDGHLEINLSRQFNRRKEFDAHRNFGTLPTSLENPNILFEITTYRGEVDLEHNWNTNFHGHIGLAAMQQVNTTDRGSLIPDYSQWTGGVYYTLKYKKPTSLWEFEGGIRYDMNRLRIDDLNPKLPDFKQNQFQGFSGTLSSVFHLSTSGFLVFQTGSAWEYTMGQPVMKREILIWYLNALLTIVFISNGRKVNSRFNLPPTTIGLTNIFSFRLKEKRS
jgi:iron complex outermembrane receptor protein